MTKSDRPRPRAGPRVYLAGPEVFLPGAEEIGERKKELAERYGFEGMFPLDLSPGSIGSRADIGYAIFDNCVSMMDGCDLCIANLTPFRGFSMDVGTAVEIGYMHAGGKPVFGYSNSGDDYEARLRAAGFSDGNAVEGFGFFDNAMCEGVVERSGGGVVRYQVDEPHRLTDLRGFEDCLSRAAASFSQFRADSDIDS